MQAYNGVHLASAAAKPREAKSSVFQHDIPAPFLLGTLDMQRHHAEAIFDRAERMERLFSGPGAAELQHELAGQTVVNLFYENSTRTRTSFEIAAKRLGAMVVNMDVATSSVEKGETLLDTAATLNAMQPDFLVIRHPYAGAPKLLARKVQASVINGGDGTHEHPTQALLDAYTMRKHLGKDLSNRLIVIAGDIRHSRVARSNIWLLTRLGARVRVVAPPTLLPGEMAQFGVELFYDMRKAVEGADVIMMLRLQRERMRGVFLPSQAEYFRYFGLSDTVLERAKPTALVMHPGPMNRGVEIETSVADLEGRSVIEEQVHMGVITRMAIFSVLADQRRAMAQAQSQEMSA